MAETAENQQLLESIREIQQEMNKIYSISRDIMDEKLLAVSREFDRLMVEYLRKTSYSADESRAVQN